MIVYRIARHQFMHDLSGKGAEIAGGRWNSKGNAMLYTSSSKSLCLLEVLVHLSAEYIPKDYYLLTIELPEDTKIKKVNSTTLQSNWKDFPWVGQTQKIGDDFLASNKQLILQAPSAIIEDEYNLLINPSHKDFEKIKITKTQFQNFDNRLLINQR